MNTKNENENETSKDAREARPTPQGADSYDTEPAPASDGSDFRETPERGYGWGV